MCDEDTLSSSSTEKVYDEPDKETNKDLADSPPPIDREDKESRGRKIIVTPKVAASLDKCRISDRDAVHVLFAVTEALGHDASQYALNRSTIYRARRILREERAAKLKERFINSHVDSSYPIVLHFDGKLFKNLTDLKKHDRIAIIILCGDIEQILEIPPIGSGTGREQADTIYSNLLLWDLVDKICAVCCDTTNANLGRFNGACVLLEQNLERDLLYLPCRHHIFEIVLRGAFDSKMPPSSSADVPLFKRFKEAWPDLDKSNFKSVMDDPKLFVFISNECGDLIEFIEKTLQRERQPRDDYREFLILSLIFLGKNDNQRIPPPGAFHHAKWMSKGIYVLKIYLFRAEFKLKKTDLKKIGQLCIFIVKIYIKAWFSATSAIRAPANDLLFMKTLLSYETTDSEISRATVSKFKNHLWYLAPESAAFSFFDSSISVEEKRKMT